MFPDGRMDAKAFLKIVQSNQKLFTNWKKIPHKYWAFLHLSFCLFVVWVKFLSETKYTWTKIVEPYMKMQLGIINNKNIHR